MDPDENLKEQLYLAQRVLGIPNGYNLHDADRLAELVISLHEWMEKGGMPPKAWKEGIIKRMYGGQVNHEEANRPLV